MSDRRRHSNFKPPSRHTNQQRNTSGHSIKNDRRNRNDDLKKSDRRTRQESPQNRSERDNLTFHNPRTHSGTYINHRNDSRRSPSGRFQNESKGNHTHTDNRQQKSQASRDGKKTIDRTGYVGQRKRSSPALHSRTDSRLSSKSATTSNNNRRSTNKSNEQNRQYTSKVRNRSSPVLSRKRDPVSNKESGSPKIHMSVKHSGHTTSKYSHQKDRRLKSNTTEHRNELSKSRSRSFQDSRQHSPKEKAQRSQTSTYRKYSRGFGKDERQGSYNSSDPRRELSLDKSRGQDFGQDFVQDLSKNQLQFEENSNYRRGESYISKSWEDQREAMTDKDHGYRDYLNRDGTTGADIQFELENRRYLDTHRDYLDEDNSSKKYDTYKYEDSVYVNRYEHERYEHDDRFHHPRDIERDDFLHADSLEPNRYKDQQNPVDYNMERDGVIGDAVEERGSRSYGSTDHYASRENFDRYSCKRNDWPEEDISYQTMSTARERRSRQDKAYTDKEGWVGDSQNLYDSQNHEYYERHTNEAADNQRESNQYRQQERRGGIKEHPSIEQEVVSHQFDRNRDRGQKSNGRLFSKTKKGFYTKRYGIRQPTRFKHFNSDKKPAAKLDPRNSENKRNPTKRNMSRLPKSTKKPIDKEYKSKAVYDRGQNGCVLREDRPYEEREKKGFMNRRRRQEKTENIGENQSEAHKNTNPIQQPVLFIPNPEFQCGVGQNVDQYGNILNLADSSKGTITHLPVQNSEGQEMIFIPFGNSANLSENNLPVQQNSFPFTFVPQFVAPDQLNINATGDSGKINEDSPRDVANDVVTSKRKPLTNNQRAKLRSQLLLRRKKMLVKEVEEKVLQNFLGKSKIIKSKVIKDKESINQKSRKDADESSHQISERDNGKKIRSKSLSSRSSYKRPKEEAAKRMIYDTVSDLEDVSDEEGEEANLSDWENVSVDEIELDANERRPKFRKPNEPRTFIHHSATKRKLNVRKSSGKIFDQDKSVDKPKRNDNTLHNKSSVHNDKMVGKNNTKSTENNVFKAYTTERVSQELQRRESETRQNNRDQMTVANISSKKQYRNRNNKRSIDSLQVTVKNNLYEKKETTYKSNQTHGYHDDMAKGYDRDRSEIEDRKQSGSDMKPSVNRRETVKQEVSYNEKQFMDQRSVTDKRIIRDKRQRFGDDDDRESHVKTLKNVEANKVAYKRDIKGIPKENKYDEVKFLDRRSPTSQRQSVDMTESFEQHRERFQSNANSKGDHYQSRNLHEHREDRGENRHTTRNSRERGDRYFGNRNKRDSTNDRTDKTEQYSYNRDRPDSKYYDKESSTADYSKSGNRRDSHFRHPTEVEELDQRNSEKTNQGFDQDIDEQNYEEELDQEIGADFDNVAMNSYEAFDTPSSQPINQVFDPSLPPIQNMPTMSAMSVSGLPDMSLPPPQALTSQFSAPQVIMQTTPLLNQQSHLQPVQQSQIVGLQQSQPLQTFQNDRIIQQGALNVQPQIAQQSFQGISQQSNVRQTDNQLQQQLINKPLQIQTQGNIQQQQQRSYQILVDHSQPRNQQMSVNQQMNLNQQQNMNSQQLQQMANLQQSQPVSFSNQKGNANQVGQQQQSRIISNQNPFQNVQQTLNNLGIEQGMGMHGRIFGVNQGQTFIQQQMQGQAQSRGYIVPASSHSRSLQGFNKVLTEDMCLPGF